MGHLVGVLGVEFDDADHAEKAGLFDGGVLVERFHELAHEGGFLLGFGDGVLGFVDAEGGEGGGAADGVPGVGVAVVEGAVAVAEVGEGVVDGVFDEGGAEGHGAAGEGFADADEVGVDAGVVVGEAFAGAAEAHGDFVDDEQDVVFLAAVGELLEVAGGVDFHAGGAEAEGFEDDGSELVGVLGDDGAAGLEAVGVVGGGVGEWEFGGVGDDVAVGFVEGVDKADAEGAEGVAVVALVHADEGFFFGSADVVPVLDGDFEGGFDGAGAIGGEEDVAVGGGHEVGEGFGEFEYVGVGHAAGDGVLEGGGLLLDGVDDLGVVVAEGAGPPAGDDVEVSVVVLVEEVDAFAADDVGEVAGLNGGEGGVGVEEVAHGISFWVRVMRVSWREWGRVEKGGGVGVSSWGV